MFVPTQAPEALSSDVLTVARLCGLVVPLAVAALTKKYTSRGIKAVLNLALSAVSGTVALVLAGSGALTVGGFFNAIVNTFITSIIAYYGAYQPTGLANTVSEKTQGFGIGSEPDDEDDEGQDEPPPPRKTTPRKTATRAAKRPGVTKKK